VQEAQGVPRPRAGIAEQAAAIGDDASLVARDAQSAMQFLESAVVGGGGEARRQIGPHRPQGLRAPVEPPGAEVPGSALAAAEGRCEVAQPVRHRGGGGGRGGRGRRRGGEDRSVASFVVVVVIIVIVAGEGE
jgi:hypothetical protein